MIDEKELPKDWEIVTLGDIVEKMTNGASVQQFEEKTGYPISRIETIWNQTIDLDRVKYIKENDPAFVEKYAVRENDILFSHINSDPHLGKTAIFKLKNFTLIHGINLLLIRASQKVYADYLNYQLIYLRRTGIFARIAQKSVNQSSINQGKLKKLEIILSPLNEQYRIVEKIEELFSELDKGVENLKTAQQQLKVYRQAVLKWAFEGALTNDDIKDGQLPINWEWKILKELCKLMGGVTKGRDFKGKNTVSIPYLRVANVQDGYLNLNEIKFIEALPTDQEKYQLIYGDILYTEGGDKDKLGRGTIWKNEIPNCIHQNHIFRARPLSDEIDSRYVAYFSQTQQAKQYFFKHGKQTTNLASINLTVLSGLPVPVCDLKEQQQIVQEIESRLSVCDKIEETITNSLQQAEALRQSILKKAFEGKLVGAQVQTAYKPKNTYFYQMQLLGIVAAASKEKGINHGEMTIAKYAYLLDKVYQIPTYYDYKRWHLGPYPPEIKKAINNAKFFTKKNGAIEVIDIGTLTKYANPYSDQLNNAVNDLSNIFSVYTGKERSHQIELLATVCKVIEDIQSTDLKAIRTSMTEWKIDLATIHFTSKAEKFSEHETIECLALISTKGWNKNLLTN